MVALIEGEGAGQLKSMAITLYCHFAVALLCLNVLFDLFVFGVPAFLLHATGLLSDEAFLGFTAAVINWTTPTVFSLPMVLSGSRIFCNDVELLIESKSKDSLLLANHGSRVDWMVGMFVGYAKHIAGKPCERIRVGYVAEALVSFLPLVGWYRKLVARDIFVWRSFKQDAPTIKANIEHFHSAGASRMLFLSPEGVVVDFGSKDRAYINECRQFCRDQNYKPFEFVLTPRYKGSMCLLEQVRKSSGPVVSVCLAYVRNGKLLNCSLLSPDRVVPDIYTLLQGTAGSPVDIYIHLKRMHIAQDLNDPKAFMMENYKEKDELLKKWDEQTVDVAAAAEATFSEVQNDKLESLAYQVGHAALMAAAALLLGRLHTLLQIFGFLFSLVAGCHTIGSALGSTSKESVPFETGIKSLLFLLQQQRKEKEEEKEKKED